jgi:16S rRNA (guanine(966)-N(2))-methyltransferase RsmD
MRVIAGSARSILLVAPRDRGTRPITDRVKETLFAILGARVPEAHVLDLYAGSGAIGIEALSRGAASVTFIERGREALAALRANLERTGLGAAARVTAGDVLRLLEAEPARRYQIAILDPPYAEHAILAPLESLVPLLDDDAVVVVKHFWRTEVPPVTGLRIRRVRRFGETSLTFLATDGDGQT